MMYQLTCSFVNKYQCLCAPDTALGKHGENSVPFTGLTSEWREHTVYQMVVSTDEEK